MGLYPCSINREPTLDADGATEHASFFYLINYSVLLPLWQYSPVRRSQVPGLIQTWSLESLQISVNRKDNVINLISYSSDPTFKGMLCDFSVLTLEQIIVLNKCCPYKKPIPKISHVKLKTLRNLCKIRYK